ncbi:uncharacterized protein LOC108953358 [Musa acuminata AAA Group]|uniref:uncharacterized protein LOC108953358 n=1 Tax=Musa acuminata AAA Group TaxID=214697 RepID=UPI0031D1E8D9
MVLDEQRRSSAGRDGSCVAGIRTVKKPKQKKIPQRGLGVAQLEKLRLEEQQKNAASSSSDPSQHPYVPLLSNEGVMRPRVLLKASVPVSATTADLVGPAQPPPASESSAKHAVLPLLWNAVDPHPTDGHAVATRFGFHVSCRKQQSPVTLVNMASSPVSSGVNLRIEPPSNQSNPNSSDLPSCWREQERIVGMKRPWQLHLDGVSTQSSYPCKLPSFSNSCPKPEEVQRAGFRGGTSTDGSFLSMGSLSTPVAKSFDNPPFYQHDHSDLGLPLSQISSGNGCSSHGQPFYSFLPMGPSCTEATPSERRGEAADGIDLNLKL